MVNKKFWLGILVMALVFGMTVVGCGDKPDNDPPVNEFEVYTWTAADGGAYITSLTQLNGTWKGSYKKVIEGVTRNVTVYITITATDANTGTELSDVFYPVGNMGRGEGGGGKIKLSDMTGVQINQDGTKIKVPAGTFFLSDEITYTDELILKKSAPRPSGSGGGEGTVPSPVDKT